MTTFFSKPVDQLTPDDVFSLVDTPEGQVFEIKAFLAAEKGKSDSWEIAPSSGQSRKGPDDYARQSIFREVVAFANVEGGWLILGLAETADSPRRVAGPTPLPDCHDLAERLERAAQDWIDPPLPSFRCRGIELGTLARAGVVVFRVPRSPIAPHRLKADIIT